MRKIITAAAALALCAQLSAQNINQSVQVTNDYITRFADFQKQGGGLQVPDSLYRFDYHFDYSVFDTPYKGAYEFSPYQIRVTPEARPYDGSRFYLRAGAGYTFHPQLDLAWQALRREDLTVGVYADARGYAGRYRMDSDTQPWGNGRDLTARAGVGGQYLRPALRLSWQAGYEGISASLNWGDRQISRSGYHSGVVAGRVQSRERPDDFIFYDADIRYRYGADRFIMGNLGEHNLHLGVSGGPVLSGKYRILLDALFEMDAQHLTVMESSSSSMSTNLAALRPHVDFLLGPVRLDAGVRLDYGEWAGQKRFTVNPDVTARLDLLDQDLTLFAAVTGGQSLQGHYDLRQVNHFMIGTTTGAYLSREKLRVRAGADGHWHSRLQYGFEAGYVSYDDLPLSGFWVVTPTDFQTVYGQVKLAWKDERVDVDGALRYDYLMLPEDMPGIAPPAFQADIRGRYNWQKRIWAGAFVEAVSARQRITEDPSILGEVQPVPGYVNLGLTGEFRIDRRWGVWAEAGNLLGMSIQRVPGVIERGPYITLGLTLKL